MLWGYTGDILRIHQQVLNIFSYSPEYYSQLLLKTQI